MLDLEALAESSAFIIFYRRNRAIKYIFGKPEGFSQGSFQKYIL
jgi:hypothetical protein